jgi:antitoxin component HigA of HigAB toxin-antitoxin module
MSVATPTVFSSRYEQLMRKFPLHQIRTKADAAKATQILDALFRQEHDDAGEAEYVYILATLLEEYEKANKPAKSVASGVDVLKHLMEEHKLTQSDVGSLLGITQSAVSMLLSGARSITAENARKLGDHFAIKPGLFI